jgi:hypothetical protein
MTEQPERMTRDDIKAFIFDDLLEFLEETGEVNAITPDEIASLITETPGRVKGCMQEMVQEGVLESANDGDTLYFHFTDEMAEQLIEEMKEAGWTPPDEDDDIL